MNRYIELSDKYASVVKSCFIKPNGHAVYTFTNGTTKKFKDWSEAEKFFEQKYAYLGK